MIKLDGNQYVAGMWFAALDGSDMHATLYLEGHKEIDKETKYEWTLDWRVRHYDEDDPRNDPFSGKDRKSRHRNKSKPMTEAEAVAMVHRSMESVNKIVPPKYYQFLPMFTSDMEIIIELMQKQGWMHAKKMTEEEYEKEYGKEANGGTT